MTGIGKSGAELQTAAGSQSFNACLSYSHGKDLLTLVRVLSSKLSG